MKLYVVKRLYDYEGFEILGIFDTWKQAHNCLKNEEFKGDGLIIDEHELNKGEIV